MELRIKNLYGRFNYDLTFMENEIKILTGPNGFGKSTILRCIDAFSRSKMDFFVNLVFDEIEMVANIGKSVVIKKKDNKLYINDHGYSYVEKYSSVASRIVIEERPEKTYDMQSMTQVAGAVKMIYEQRLLTEQIGYRIINGERRTTRFFDEAIKEIPNKFVKKIMQTVKSYSEITARLDRSFPYRLLEEKSEVRMDEKKFYAQYEDMEKKLNLLSKYEISEVLEVPQYTKLKFQEHYAKMLEIFFKDFNQKYDIYEALIKKILLFEDVVNRRFRFKYIKFSGKQGLSVLDEKTQEKIPLSSLSSGEKETIILFYDLIFDTDENTLILLDEPEISLHIEWQINFIDDLMKIVELNHIGVLIATHSADIIGANWDMQIDLGALYQDGFHT